MAFFKKDQPEQAKSSLVVIPEQDQLDSLRHRWLARLLEAGGDLNGAAMSLSYAQLVDAYNEAKQMAKAYPLSADWAHRKDTLTAQLRNERSFWRELRSMEDPALVRITDEKIDWPSDEELLRGA